MNKTVKILIEVLLGLLIAGLTWAFIASIQKPVKFNEEVKAREKVGIQRLKDIRTLQEAFKSVNGRFSHTVDSLKLFYASCSKVRRAVSWIPPSSSRKLTTRCPQKATASGSTS